MQFLRLDLLVGLLRAFLGDLALDLENHLADTLHIEVLAIRKLQL
jgi:hypothetical protein